jgi:hypothetical protein
MSKWLIATVGIFSISSAADAALFVTKASETTNGGQPFNVESPVLPAMSAQRPLDETSAEIGTGNLRLIISQFDDDDGGGDEGGGDDGGGDEGGGDEGGGGGGGDEGGGGGGGTNAVPEPASWMMLVIGFGLTGAAMRLSVRARKSL